MSSVTEWPCPHCGANLGAVGRQVMGGLEFCGACKRSVLADTPAKDLPGAVSLPDVRRSSAGDDPRRVKAQ